jgi:hypothetical protein
MKTNDELHVGDMFLMDAFDEYSAIGWLVIGNINRHGTSGFSCAALILTDGRSRAGQTASVVDPVYFRGESFTRLHRWCLHE